MGIILNVGDVECDLHGDLNFDGVEYRPAEQKALLRWTGPASQGPVRGVTLSFDGVTALVATRRDAKLPFTEDLCVATVAFLPPGCADLTGVLTQSRSDDEHFSLDLQSGANVKIWAESVSCTLSDSNKAQEPTT